MTRSKETGPPGLNQDTPHKSKTTRIALASAVFLALVLLAPQCWASNPPKVQSILRTAQGLLGIPYRSGGDRPEIGFDCSGFVSFVLGQNGIDLGRSSPEQFKHGRKISLQELNPGDLVFFSSSQGRVSKSKHKHKSKLKSKAKVTSQRVARVTHVGIYIGKGEFIHAASGNARIQVNELREDYWARHYYGARRI
jgi:cell wall-associated NlpC family hydrolase